MPQQVPLARGDEADRVAGASRAAGAADPVHVRLGVGGDVVVDDVAHPLDVEPAGGDVGRDQDVELGVLELLHRALALRLHHVAVDRRGRVAPGAQPLGEGLGLVLGADEDDQALEVLHLEQPGEHVDLLRVADHQVPLGDRGRRAGRAADLHLRRLAQVLLRQAAHLGRHRRREQRDLLVVRGGGQDRLDVLGEPHAEHLVGLVEHQHLQRRQVERPLVEVVHDPAGRADDHVHAAPQRAELHAVALAAVHRQDVHALGARGVPLERLADLERELAGRRQHQRLRASSAAGRAGPGSAARTRRSCRCRSAPCRSGRVPRAAPGWWPPAPRSGSRSRRRRGRAAPARPARGRRTCGRARRRPPSRCRWRVRVRRSRRRR